MARSTNTQFAVAVHVLTYLGGASDGRVVSSEELADSTRVNAVHVRRVLGPLRQAGLVRSRPGAHGGWELATLPGDIRLGRVWALLQADEPLLGLHGPNPECSIGQRIQHSLGSLDRAATLGVREQLDRFTVADLLADRSLEARHEVV